MGESAKAGVTRPSVGGQGVTWGGEPATRGQGLASLSPLEHCDPGEGAPVQPCPVRQPPGRTGRQRTRAAAQPGWTAALGSSWAVRRAPCEEGGGEEPGRLGNHGGAGAGSTKPRSLCVGGREARTGTRISCRPRLRGCHGPGLWRALGAGTGSREAPPCPGFSLEVAHRRPHASPAPATLLPSPIPSSLRTHVKDNQGPLVAASSPAHTTPHAPTARAARRRALPPSPRAKQQAEGQWSWRPCEA